MTISTVHNSSYVSRRLVAFVAILAVHALVIWAFISGFANQGARYVETILQTNMIQTEKPKELPPPPPPVDLKERPPGRPPRRGRSCGGRQSRCPFPPIRVITIRTCPAVTARKAARSSKSVSM